MEDLDVDNLGVGALNGDVLLIDLKLRPDALVLCIKHSLHIMLYIFSHFWKCPLKLCEGVLESLV